MKETRTIVITTTEQAEAMLAHLDRLSEAAKADDYASEKAKPIEELECCCCGEWYMGRQWWNQDTNYGLGDCCVKFVGADPTPGALTDAYGVSGIHFLIK